MIALLPLRGVAAEFPTGSPQHPAAVRPVGNDCGMPHALALAVLVALAPPWGWPVDPPHVIVRPYIAPETPYSAGHRGVDLAAPGGTVRAPADGVVHFSGTVVDRPVLSIAHPGGVLSSYEPVESVLVAGDRVVRGQPLGVVVPGHCPALCLHFGVRVHGNYVSPLNWIGGREPAVLLPTRASARPRSRATDHLYPRRPVGERSPLHLRRAVPRG